MYALIGQKVLYLEKTSLFYVKNIKLILQLEDKEKFAKKGIKIYI